jgi:hypothetical protein
LAKAKVYAKNYANNILITRVLLEQFCASWKKFNAFYGVFIARIKESCDSLIEQKISNKFVY